MKNNKPIIDDRSNTLEGDGGVVERDVDYEELFVV